MPCFEELTQGPLWNSGNLHTGLTKAVRRFVDIYLEEAKLIFGARVELTTLCESYG